jgi:hypothetical protein
MYASMDALNVWMNSVCDFFLIHKNLVVTGNKMCLSLIMNILVTVKTITSDGQVARH